MPEKPKLRLYARFSPLVVLYKHPARLCVSLCVPFFAFPDLGRIAAPLLHLPILTAGLAAASVVATLIVLPQLAASWMDCRFVPYDVYDDCLVFTENFFIRTPIRVPFRKVTHVGVAASPAQRLRGLADVRLTTQVSKRGIVGQKQYYVIPNLRKKDAEKAGRVISSLVAAAQSAS